MGKGLLGEGWQDSPASLHDLGVSEPGMWVWSCFHCSVAGLEEEAEVKSMSSGQGLFRQKGSTARAMAGDNRRLHS